MVIESDLLADRGDRYELADAFPPLAIPSTLQDSLMARLDRLATRSRTWPRSARRSGARFTTSCCGPSPPSPMAALQRALARLGESDLLYQRGVPPEATYAFKHALIQETAYQSMLVSRRQQLLHTRIGDTMIERFPETDGQRSPSWSRITTPRPG